MYQLLLISLFSLFINLSYQFNYQGTATVYGGQIYGGSCGFKSIWANKNMNFNYGVAINSKQYNNSLSCGKCVNIEYNNRNINAIVTDICPECQFGDLDLFTQTYNTLIQEDPGRKNIKWNFIDCPNDIVSNNLQLRIDEINYYWLSIQPENFKCGISKIFIKQNNKWLELTRNDNIMTGLYFIYNTKVNIPFQLKIINEYNEEIISDEYYEIKNLFILNNQFSCINNHKEVSINQNNLNLNFDCN
jgi:expansin (peptidoglycan-binding protein)